MSNLTRFFLSHGIEEPVIKSRADHSVKQDLLLAGENRGLEKNSQVNFPSEQRKRVL